MFSPSVQLENELQASIKSALLSKRPILTHLNADSTWLLQLPIPSPSPDRVHIRRSRFNILIDPWLSGPQSDVAGFFSTQWHKIESSVQKIAELEQLLEEIETLEFQLDFPSKPTPRAREDGRVSFIDAVMISHEFTDHCHKETLLEIHSSVPIIASQKSADLVRSWNHFSTVLYAPRFTHGTDWRSTSIGHLPSWLGISRIVTESDVLHYHSAMLISFEPAIKNIDETGENIQEATEGIIYTPHGIQADDLRPLTGAKPPLRILALLHGLHDVSISLALTKQLNLGAHNGLKAQRLVKAKYWVGTHDEVKIGGGVVAAFLRRKVYSLRDAMDQETRLNVSKVSAARGLGHEVIQYEDLASGQSLLLE